MYLGIAPGYDGLHHDPSACLTDSDQVHAFVEEERMSRNKHASGEFPIAAIEECLDIASIEFDDIEKIGLSRNYDNRRKGLIRLARRSARSNIGLGEKLWDTILLPIKQTVTLTNKSLQSTVTTHLSNHFSIDKSNIPTIDCINHHRTTL
jgi:carbamoyltransferase